MPSPLMVVVTGLTGFLAGAAGAEGRVGTSVLAALLLIRLVLGETGWLDWVDSARAGLRCALPPALDTAFGCTAALLPGVPFLGLVVPDLPAWLRVFATGAFPALGFALVAGFALAADFAGAGFALTDLALAGAALPTFGFTLAFVATFFTPVFFTLAFFAGAFAGDFLVLAGALALMLALLRAGLAGLRLAGLALAAFLATVLDLAVFLVAISGSLHVRCSSYELLWILLHFLFPLRLCIPMHWATRRYVPGRFQEARYATRFRRALPQESGPEAACSGRARRGQETVVDEHVAVADVAVERPQGFPATGTKYAEAGVGFEQRAMCCATQQTALCVHEVIFLPVERNTKMRAAIEPGRDRAGSVVYHDH